MVATVLYNRRFESLGVVKDREVFRLKDGEVKRINTEVAVRGGNAWVDDVGMRKYKN